MTTARISSAASMWRSTRNPGSLSRQITRANGTRSRYAPQLFAQLVALDLAGGGLRKVVAEFDPARVFPHPDPLLFVLLQGFGQRIGILALRRLLQHDKGLGLDQALRVGMANDRRFKYRGMPDQRLLDLKRRHPDAADLQHVVAAAAVAVIAIGIAGIGVAGM